MKTRSISAVAVCVALFVLAAGATYAVLRPVEWQSTARLVLVPTPADPSDIPSTLDGLNASGTVATYVELLSSSDLLKRAGSPPVSLSVRSIPDSRVIALTTVGEEKAVQPGLTDIVRAGAEAQGTLQDLWSLRTIEAPSRPERSGVPVTTLLLATALLALLAALVAFVALRRLEPAATAEPEQQRRGEPRVRAVHGSRER